MKGRRGDRCAVAIGPRAEAAVARAATAIGLTAGAAGIRLLVMARGKPKGGTGKQRTSEIVAALRRAYPDAGVELLWETPLQLLVATILSAQCTDERVNQVTRKLFARYRKAADYAHADPAEFEQEIRPTGFYRNKTKLVLGAARRLVDDYGGDVPAEMADLLTLPGVARKTANLVLGTAFGKATGVVVDTHVKRVAYRLGLTENDDRGRSKPT